MHKFVPDYFKQEVPRRASPTKPGYTLLADPTPELADDGSEASTETMLFRLQLQCAQAGADLQGLEPAMKQLAEQLSAASDTQLNAIAESNDWCLKIGPALLNEELVTVTRGGYLLAILRPDCEGCLIATSFRPLDAHTLRLLIRLSARPHPRFGVAMSLNNWEYVLDTAIGEDNLSASSRDEPHLQHFESGILDNGLVPLTAAQTAIQLEVFCKLEGIEVQPRNSPPAHQNQASHLPGTLRV